MKRQTIGVEIELTGLTRKAAAEAVANYFGTTAEYVGGAYDAYEVKDNGGRTWNFKRDTSIKPQVLEGGEKWCAGDEYKVEFITPVLRYKDLETLENLVEVIKAAGGFVNGSTGMHVHVGSKDLTTQGAVNLLKIVASKQDLIYKALNVKESRESYCQKFTEEFMNELLSRKPQDDSELASVWYGEPIWKAEREHAHYDESRYHLVNLHSAFMRGTVEYRMFNSTLEASEVKAAVQFCLAVTHYAKTTERVIYRKTETASDKFTFRTWLRQLGLNGSEYADCRKYLLKNLTGSIYRAVA